MALSPREQELILTEAEKLLEENKRLRQALADIVNASRDDGLAAMCNWMRDRAFAALQGRKEHQ